MANGQIILECLTDYIGLVSCDTTEPGSELFINELPGISSEVLQIITNTEDETYVTTWNEIQKRGIFMFRSQLMSELNECYQINKLDTVECLACEHKELFSIALWYLLGSLVMVQTLMNWNNTHFTTVDRQSAEEIRDYFFNQFKIELRNAVKGIDVEESDCIKKEDTCMQQNGKIHYRESMM